MKVTLSAPTNFIIEKAMRSVKKSVAAILITSILAGCNSDSDDSPKVDDPLANLPQSPAGRWVKGDHHVHSTLTDGYEDLITTLDKSYHFGADFIFSTDHSGFGGWYIGNDLYRLMLDGSRIENPYGPPHDYEWAKTFADQKLDDGKPQGNEVTYNAIEAYRQNKLEDGQYLLFGLELTVKSVHEAHSTAWFPEEDGWRTVDEFNSLCAGGYPGTPGDREYMLWCLDYIEERDGIWLMNHPSRKHRQNEEERRFVGLSIGDLRQFNDHIPATFVGMEGAPGHHIDDRGRGYYREEPVYLDEYTEEYGIAYHGRTYGGFDFMTSRIGGVWDALLSEGRRFFITANSDFHTRNRDFWPLEYSATHSFLKEESMEGIAQSLRDGKMYVNQGRLVEDLYFVARSRETNQHAWMGEELVVPAGQKVDIIMTMKSPELHNVNEFDIENASLSFVDLIAGKVGEKIGPGHPDYEKPFVDTSEVVATFERGGDNWIQEADGTIKLTYTINNLEEDMYFRLRGSNNPKGTELFVDEEGNPMLDLDKEGSMELLAWNDRWVYSNPIFVSTEK